MPMTGIERIVRDAIAVLQDGMATVLAALETECADGVLLPAPADEAYFWYRPDLLPSYPAVIVLGLPEVPSNLDLAGGYDFDYAVQIDLVVPATDPAAAQVLAWRYWRAVKELLTPTCIDNAHTLLQAVDWNQPAWTPEGFSGPVKDIPGLITVQTTERA